MWQNWPACLSSWGKQLWWTIPLSTLRRSDLVYESTCSKYYTFLMGRLAPAKWWCWGWPESTITIPTRSYSPIISRTRRIPTYAPVWAKPSMIYSGSAGRCGRWRWITPNTPFLRRLWYFLVSPFALARSRPYPMSPFRAPPSWRVLSDDLQCEEGGGCRWWGALVCRMYRRVALQ